MLSALLIIAVYRTCAKTNLVQPSNYELAHDESPSSSGQLLERPAGVRKVLCLILVRDADFFCPTHVTTNIPSFLYLSEDKICYHLSLFSQDRISFYSTGHDLEFLKTRDCNSEHDECFFPLAHEFFYFKFHQDDVCKDNHFTVAQTRECQYVYIWVYIKRYWQIIFLTLTTSRVIDKVILQSSTVT